MKKFLLCFLILVCSVKISFAQNATVTGTVTGPSGLALGGGIVTISISNPTGGTAIDTTNGAPVASPAISVLNAVGALTATNLRPNSLIVPAGTQWNFKVCSAGNEVCNSTNLTLVTGANDLSTQLSALFPSGTKLATATHTPVAYAISDLANLTPVMGDCYYSAVSLAPVCYTGTTWSSLVQSGTSASLFSITVTASVNAATLSASGTVQGATVVGTQVNATNLNVTGTQMLKKQVISFGIASLPANSCGDMTGTYTGALTSNIAVASPTAASAGWASVTWNVYVSATNTIDMHICNASTAAVTPTSIPFNVTVF